VFNKGTELVVTTLMVKSCNERNVSNLAHNIPNQDGETISREGYKHILFSQLQSKIKFGPTVTRFVKSMVQVIFHHSCIAPNPGYVLHYAQICKSQAELGENQWQPQ
jgi:hypothetical protein